MGGPRLAVATAVGPTDPPAVKSTAMKTTVEPDAVSEDEMVEVVKTVPAKEANSNDDEGVTEPVVIKISVQRGTPLPLVAENWRVTAPPSTMAIRSNSLNECAVIAST